MPRLNGDNQVDIIIQSKADNKGIDSSSNSLKRLEGQSEASAKSLDFLGGIARAATIGMALVGGAAATAGLSAIKGAASFEQTRIGLENMLGSADAAKGVLKDVSQFAANTPFEFPELAGSVKQLVAFGYTGDEAIATMKQLGDVSAAIGAPIGDLSYLMGTLRTQGRAYTVDIKQLGSRGVPIYEYLAKVLGVAKEEVNQLVESGKVGFPEVSKAIELMTSEGGKFHGTMIKQSKSMTGLWSTLKDVIGLTARELVGITQEGDVKTGSLFDRIRTTLGWLIESMPHAIDVMKGAVSNMLPTLTKWRDNVIDIAKQVEDKLQPKLKALWDTINTDILPLLTRLWKEVLEPLIPVLGVALVGAIGLVIDGLNLLLAAVQPVISWIGDNTHLVTAMAVAFSGIALAMKIDDVKTLFLSNMSIITDRIGGMKTKFMDAVDGIGGAKSAAAWGIFAAAAVIAFTVINGWIDETKAKFDGLLGVTNSNVAKLAQAKKDFDTGIITLEEYKRISKEVAEQAQRDSQTVSNEAKKIEGSIWSIRNPLENARRLFSGIGTFLSGGSGDQVLSKLNGYAAGGFTGPGGKSDVAGIVHKGEYVVPKDQVDQSTGMPKAGSTGGAVINQTNYIYNDLDMNRANIELGWRLANA